MIKSKRDYIYYLEADLAANGINKWRLMYKYIHPVLYFQRILRKVEYYHNCRCDLVGHIYSKYLSYILLKNSIKLGLTIPPNVFGPGLRISHYGNVVVSPKTIVGKNCLIHSGVNIGDLRGSVPKIGDYVYIGPGAKLFGNITIGNNVAIGANAVVNKDIPDNVTVAGVPAKIISRNNSDGLQREGLLHDGCRTKKQQA
jgi:serine O-acetyltransferase